MDAVSIRGEWVGQVIDGRFPLLEWLGGSRGNGVFLTQLAAPDTGRAAIKLIPASASAEDRFTGWKSAASLSHPHLLRIRHFGRAEIEEANLVYIVTDFADELLSQIIPERALTADETREMLRPVLDTLDYLHGNGYVHGHLKPTNILVVENEVKLSSDSLLPIGSFAPEFPGNNICIAPEAASSPAAPPADVWSLGITLVEALTQEPLIWDAASGVEPIVPKSVPEPFAAIARECLHVDPARRATLNQIRALLDGKPKPVEPALPHLPHHPHRLADKSIPAKIPLLPIIIGLVLLVAIIVVLQVRSHKTPTPTEQTKTTQQAAPAEPDPRAASAQSKSESPAPPPTTTSTAAQSGAESSKGAVVSRSLPNVPRQASNTIHGTVGVVVRVNVDVTGAVTQAELASRGPSAYFARLAVESARDWKFKPPQQDGHAAPSTWLLHYAYRRDGVDVRPEEKTP